jgi:hypothetical protein
MASGAVAFPSGPAPPPPVVPRTGSPPRPGARPRCAEGKAFRVARRTPRARSPSLVRAGRSALCRVTASAAGRCAGVPGRRRCDSPARAGPGGGARRLGQPRPATIVFEQGRSRGERATAPVVGASASRSGRSDRPPRNEYRERAIGRPPTPGHSPDAGHSPATGIGGGRVQRLHLRRRLTFLRSAWVAPDSSVFPDIASACAGAAARSTCNSRSGISWSRRSSASCRSAWSSSASASDCALGRSGSFDLLP